MKKRVNAVDIGFLIILFTVLVVSCDIAAAEISERAEPEQTYLICSECAEPIEPMQRAAVRTTTTTQATTTTTTAKAVTLYNVPLDEALQLHIISEAEKHGIDPAIIFAMCWKESTYRASTIGDNGNSYGLMQIQRRWHSARMERLGCSNLLDPYQNVKVGIDYLSELRDCYDGDIAKALVAYNQGSYKGTVTKYARAVLAKAEELRASHESA